MIAETVGAALKAGADAAEAVMAERQSLSVNVREGALEEVEREEARDLGLRVFIGKRQATVSGSDVSPEARTKLVERAVAMAPSGRISPWRQSAMPSPMFTTARASCFESSAVRTWEEPPKGTCRNFVPVSRSSASIARWSSEPTPVVP